MSLATSRATWVLGATLAILSGCGLPTPATHAILHVSPQGHFTLDAQPVSEAALPALLRARHALSPALMVEVQASPQADIAHIKAAILASRQAHVRLSFVKDGVPV